MFVQGDVAARKALLHLSESAWADALMEVALCERELDDPFAVGTGTTTAVAAADDTSGSLKVTVRIFHRTLLCAIFHSVPLLNS